MQIRWFSLCGWLLIGLPLCPNAVNSQSRPVPPLTVATTPAPNTSLPAWNDDERLLRKVTLHVEGQAISEVLALLSKQTGVGLTAQRDIGTEKIIAFVPARPLRDTLQDMAALFNNVWQQATDAAGRPRYVLMRTLKARQYEDSLAESSAHRYQAQMDEMTQALRETPEQLAGRPDNDVIRACLQNPERRLAAQFYALLNPGQQGQLFEEGQTDSVPFARLSFPQQQALSDWQAVVEAQSKNPPPLSDVPDRAALSGIGSPISRQDMEQANIHFDIGGPAPSGGAAAVRLIVGDSSLMLRTLHDRNPRELPPHGNPYTLTPVSKTAALPDEQSLHKALREKQWADKLRVLSQITNRPILSDYFRSFACVQARYVGGLQGKDDITRLDSFSGYYQRLWWTRSSTLLFRLRRWPTERDYEVPDEWVSESVRRLLPHRDAPTQGDLYRLLELTPKQIVGLQRFDGIDREGVAPGTLRLLNASLFLNLVHECLPDTTRLLPLIRLLPPDPHVQHRLVPFEDWPASAQALLPRLLRKSPPDLLQNSHTPAFEASWSYPVTLVGAPARGYPPAMNSRLQAIQDLHQQWADATTTEERKQVEEKLLPLQRETFQEQLRALDAGDTHYINPHYLRANLMLYAQPPLKQNAGDGPTMPRLLGQAILLLPLALPDDRRDKTVITALPK